MPTSIEGTPGETRTVEFDLVSFFRRFEEEGTLRLTLATTDAGFNSARQSAGVVVDNAASTLPVHAVEGAGNLDSRSSPGIHRPTGGLRGHRVSHGVR